MSPIRRSRIRFTRGRDRTEARKGPGLKPIDRVLFFRRTEVRLPLMNQGAPTGRTENPTTGKGYKTADLY
jgi:hypothetical protein